MSETRATAPRLVKRACRRAARSPFSQPRKLRRVSRVARNRVRRVPSRPPGRSSRWTRAAPRNREEPNLAPESDDTDSIRRSKAPRQAERCSSLSLPLLSCRPSRPRQLVRSLGKFATFPLSVAVAGLLVSVSNPSPPPRSNHSPHVKGHCAVHWPWRIRKCSVIQLPALNNICCKLPAVAALSDGVGEFIDSANSARPGFVNLAVPGPSGETPERVRARAQERENWM